MGAHGSGAASGFAKVSGVLRLADLRRAAAGGEAGQRLAGALAALFLICASMFWPATSAGADQIGSTRAEISALEAQVATGAHEVHELTVSYDQASLRANALAGAVAAESAVLAQVENQASSDQLQLRQEAIDAYTGSMGDQGDLLEGSSRSGEVAVSNPGIGSVYLEVAAGDLSDSADQYHLDELQVASTRAALEQQDRLAQVAASVLGSDRQQAIIEANAVQLQLNDLQSELQQLVVAASATSAAEGPPVYNGLVNEVSAAVSGAPSGADPGGVWLELRECESSDNYRADTGNGYYGAYQFSQQTWTDLGYPGRPDLEPPTMQDQAAMKLQAQSGWGQWPACSAALGLT